MTLHTRGLDFLREVDVRLSVELGRTDMKLKDVLALGEDSVVMLDRLTDELLDVKIRYAESYREESRDLAGFLDPVQRAQYFILRERLLDRAREVQEDSPRPLLRRRPERAP